MHYCITAHHSLIPRPHPLRLRTQLMSDVHRFLLVIFVRKACKYELNGFGGDRKWAGEATENLTCRSVPDQPQCTM